MAEIENSKDLLSVLWSGADILRSKMDANEYKDYLLGIVFYKYLSDSFLIKVYDLLNDEKPSSLKAALEEYREALKDESADELMEEIKSTCHYVIDQNLHILVLRMQLEIIHLTENIYRKHLIIFEQVILYLQIYLQILICILIV